MKAIVTFLILIISVHEINAQLPADSLSSLKDSAININKKFPEYYSRYFLFSDTLTKKQIWVCDQLFIKQNIDTNLLIRDGANLIFDNRIHVRQVNPTYYKDEDIEVITKYHGYDSSYYFIYRKSELVAVRELKRCFNCEIKRISTFFFFDNAKTIGTLRELIYQKDIVNQKEDISRSKLVFKAGMKEYYKFSETDKLHCN